MVNIGFAFIFSLAGKYWEACTKEGNTDFMHRDALLYPL
jgi:hypothetical protein